MGNSFPNDNISYSSSSLPTAYQGLWATLSPTTTSATAAALCPRPIRGCGQLFPQRQHQLQQQLFAHGLSGAVGNSSPSDNISYSSSSLPTAYQGLWATLSPTITSATAAALCPWPIRGCGQLFPQRQHQLQQQLPAHGLSGAVGNSSPNDNISYSSSSLTMAYQELWATLSPTITSATAAALCPWPIRGCGQLFPQRQHQLQQQLFAHGLSGAVGNSFPTTTSATAAAACSRPIRGCGQLFPQRQHQLQQQLFAHGLSGAVGNSFPNDNISYSRSSLSMAYQGLWATLSQRQHQLQQHLFAHGLSGAGGNSFPNDNISYSSSSLPTAYQGLWATLPPTTTSATAAALCPRPIRGCGQLFPQRQHQLQQQLFVHGLSGAVGNSFPNDNISYSSSSLPTAYQGLWATLPPATTSATAAARCPRLIRGCGQLFPQR